MTDKRFKFTDAKLRDLAATETVFEYRDTETKLGLVVYPGGRKTFQVHVRIDGRPAHKTCGNFDFYGVDGIKVLEARLRQSKALTAAGQGIHPSLTDAAPSSKVTLAAMLESHIQSKITGGMGVRAKAIRSVFNLHILPTLGHKTIEAVTTADIEKVLKGLADDGRVTQRNRTFEAIRHAYNWAGKRHTDYPMLQRNPCDPIERLDEPRMSDFLEQSEAVAFMLELEKIGNEKMRDAYEIMVRTMLRTTNVLGMRWEWIDFKADIFHVPADSSKSRKILVIPMTPRVKAILQRRKIANAPGCPWVFPRWEGGANGANRNGAGHATKQLWIVQHAELCYAAGALKPKLDDDGQEMKNDNGTIMVPKISPHGWRHTAKTLCSRAGMIEEWVELAMSHTVQTDESPKGGTIKQHYNHNKTDGVRQRFTVLTAWEQVLAGEVLADEAPAEMEVLEMPGLRRATL